MGQDQHEERDCGSDSGCCGDVDRRDFLKAAGLGVAAASIQGSSLAWAGALDRPGPIGDHLVPARKRLSRAWVKDLYARGKSHVYSGKDLDAVGMPVGGIGAGQVYLLGDGRLGCWQIFNGRYFSGTGGTSYARRVQEAHVEQGFAVVVESGGETRLKKLNREDFPDVAFTGEYPIGRVNYRDDGFPVRVDMEAFSPFIPLNDEDSTLPATVFHITLENRSDQPVKAGVLAWLENAVCSPSASEARANLETRIDRDNEDETCIFHTATVLQERNPPAQEERKPVVLADFEGSDHGDWKAAGKAFGTGPARGTLPRQQEVTGFLGKGLVNTYRNQDRSTGTLTSPPFEVSRKFLNFLIGGGNHRGRTCVDLVLDNKVVHSATGKNDERLTWRTIDLARWQGKTAHIRIVDRHRGGWGHVNVDHIELSDTARIEPVASLDGRPDFGSMALALAGKAAGEERTAKRLTRLTGLQAEAIASSRVVRENTGRYASAVLSGSEPLGPGEVRTVSFVLAWHFPNLETAGIKGLKNHRYATRFEDARAVARYVLVNRVRLTWDTRAWHEAFYGGTLPRWLLHRVHSTVSNLATGLCYVLEDGRFWAWEGVGCCHGTCTHVWNYAHALAHLFPRLERSIREKQDLGPALEADGLVRFRGETNRHGYAADGQAGTVLKCYREHLLSTDDAFLNRNWPRIKKVLEYSIRKDADADGLIECSQHNTFDINFHGANTFVGSLYLAALRAGEAMAREMGEEAEAERFRKIFESGRGLTLERLWNGHYFFQDVDLKKHPRRQYADGCLSDQLFGQGWAHQVGLGYVYPREHVRKALASVWKYNWAPDVGPHNKVHPPQRCFAGPGEAGLFTCTWPKSRHLGRDSVLYRNEVWTGIEYQVAGHMIREGLVKEGLAMVRGIHERYHPRKRNPYNEVECGDHYARALASWGVFTALQGFEHHGPGGHLGFAPRMSPEDFRSAFTAAGGWGVFAQKRAPGIQTETVTVRWGEVKLRSLAFTVPDDLSVKAVSVTVQDRPVEAAWSTDHGRLALKLEKSLVLAAGENLQVEVRS